MVEGKRTLGRGNRQAGPGGKEGERGGLLGRGEKGGWATALGRAGEVGRGEGRRWAAVSRGLGWGERSRLGPGKRALARGLLG